jgi:hypothetical protein
VPQVASFWPKLNLLLCILLMSGVQGCATNRDSASVAPGRDISSLKKLLVITSVAEERGTDRIIANALKKMGFEASIGPDRAARKDVDAVVTYRAQWGWDLTPYLLELTIFIRQAQDDALLAVGNSYHTSVTRMSADEMTLEVLTNILKAAKKD